MISNKPLQVACLAASLRPAPIFRLACTKPASAWLPSAIQKSSQGRARTRTPPGGKIALPSASSCTMNCASLRHRLPKSPPACRLALYSKVMCDMCSVLDAHRRDGTTYREDRNRRVVMQLAPAFGCCRDADEGADLEAPLAGIAIGLLIGIRQHGLLVVARPAVQEFPVPCLVDLARVRRRRPMRNAAGAHQGDPLG